MEEVFTVWHNVPQGTIRPKVMSVLEAMQNLCDKYGFGDGGNFLLAAAPVVPQVPQVPQAPRDAALIQCHCLEDVAYKIVRLMTPGPPAEATVSAHSAVSAVSAVSIVPSGAARSTGPIRRAAARRSRKFNPISDPQMPYGRYPDIPKDLKQNWASESSPKSLRLLQRITFGVLESTYVGSHGAASIAACEEGAKREQLFVQILCAIEALSAEETRVLDAAAAVVAPFSARGAYFTKDPAVLKQTLRGFIQAAFDAKDVDKVCAAFIDVLHRNGHDGLVRSSALWCHSPRTMLDMPLRSLCGITTMRPHFHFAQKAFESSESSESSEGAEHSRLQSLVGPIKARLEAMTVSVV